MITKIQLARLIPTFNAKELSTTFLFISEETE